ncbi:zinc-dependent alcohol dehydrogenase family protein [Niveibacterium terrae]|uniref:zinc-dependent alcohol dehydrogenase family protein n=1 Tax=Niveibacterium terrae TaxID=3373598 RepID=UPI003A8F1DCC
MNSLQAMCLAAPHEALIAIEAPLPAPGPGELLLRVEACGVCRTDLHLVDGELSGARYPIIPGHEIVARVESCSPNSGFTVGQRVGVPWLGWTCGKCRFCLSGRENLCNEARFTGCQIDGGYASHCIADARYCFALPDEADPVSLAPLLCAGLIGYRALRFAGEARRIGLFGFGAAAHIVAQVARDEGREVYAFTRADDHASQAFALSLGATWAGSSSGPSPAELDAALIFAPVGALVPAALRAVGKGGCVVCAGIHMSEIPSFPYAWLWGERQIRSVANLTRADGDGFFADIARHPPQTHTTAFPLSHANDALQQLRAGRLQGAAVLVP